MDEEKLRLIRTENWKGFVPLQFELAGSDLGSDFMPPIKYIWTSRFGHLHVVASEVCSFLKDYVVTFVQMHQRIWFSFSSEKGLIPLPSDLPIGCLVDVLDAHHHSLYPLKITVHFSSFSTLAGDKILEICNQRDATRHFFHCFKQAIYLINGNNTVFTMMLQAEQTCLFRATSSGNYLEFESIVSDEMKAEREVMKNIPIRVISLNKNRTTIVVQHSPHKLSSSSEKAEESVEMSVGQYLNESHADLGDTLPEDYCIIVQGLIIPPDQPLFELWNVLHHGDLYLNIIILER